MIEPEKIATNRTKVEIVLAKQYKRARYICAGCGKRWGEPIPSGYLDLKRCSGCPPFTIMKGTNGKHQ